MQLFTYGLILGTLYFLLIWACARLISSRSAAYEIDDEIPLTEERRQMLIDAEDEDLF